MNMYTYIYHAAVCETVMSSHSNELTVKRQSKVPYAPSSFFDSKKQNQLVVSELLASKPSLKTYNIVQDIPWELEPQIKPQIKPM